MEKYMTSFTVHSVKTAPEKSREILESWQKKLGFIPNIMGVMADSPALLKGYNDIFAGVERGSFSPIEREIVSMTISLLNDSPYCVAAHSTWAEKAGVGRDVIDQLRKEQPLKDAKLEALRLFTRSVMKKMGRVDEKDLNAFYKAGYTKAHVLEVILSLSLNTITNYTNHIAAPSLDKAFEPNRVEGGRKQGERASNAA
jgi:uncharacterized peroxidase-related enzyme